VNPPPETAPSIAPKIVSAPRSAPPSAPSTESPLARELESLDRARSALNRGDAAGALADIDRYERAFPRGSLRNEAQVLRAEALLAKGDRAGARALAKQLLTRDPSGPHAKRLRTIAGDDP
jgi:TolA-binding protein